MNLQRKVEMSNNTDLPPTSSTTTTNRHRPVVNPSRNSLNPSESSSNRSSVPSGDSSHDKTFSSNNSNQSRKNIIVNSTTSSHGESINNTSSQYGDNHNRKGVDNMQQNTDLYNNSLDINNQHNLTITSQPLQHQPTNPSQSTRRKSDFVNTGLNKPTTILSDNKAKLKPTSIVTTALETLYINGNRSKMLTPSQNIMRTSKDTVINGFNQRHGVLLGPSTNISLNNSNLNRSNTTLSSLSSLSSSSSKSTSTGSLPQHKHDTSVELGKTTTSKNTQSNHKMSSIAQTSSKAQNQRRFAPLYDESSDTDAQLNTSFSNRYAVSSSSSDTDEQISIVLKPQKKLTSKPTHSDDDTSLVETNRKKKSKKTSSRSTQDSKSINYDDIKDKMAKTESKYTTPVQTTASTSAAAKQQAHFMRKSLLLSSSLSQEARDDIFDDFGQDYTGKLVSKSKKQVKLLPNNELKPKKSDQDKNKDQNSTKLDQDQKRHSMHDEIDFTDSGSDLEGPTRMKGGRKKTTVDDKKTSQTTIKTKAVTKRTTDSDKSVKHKKDRRNNQSEYIKSQGKEPNQTMEKNNQYNLIKSPSKLAHLKYNILGVVSQESSNFEDDLSMLTDDYDDEFTRLSLDEDVPNTTTSTNTSKLLTNQNNTDTTIYSSSQKVQRPKKRAKMGDDDDDDDQEEETGVDNLDTTSKYTIDMDDSTPQQRSQDDYINSNPFLLPNPHDLSSDNILPTSHRRRSRYQGHLQEPPLTRPVLLFPPRPLIERLSPRSLASLGNPQPVRAHKNAMKYMNLNHSHYVDDAFIKISDNIDEVLANNNEVSQEIQDLLQQDKQFNLHEKNKKSKVGSGAIKITTNDFDDDSDGIHGGKTSDDDDGDDNEKSKHVLPSIPPSQPMRINQHDLESIATKPQVEDLSLPHALLVSEDNYQDITFNTPNKIRKKVHLTTADRTYDRYNNLLPQTHSSTKRGKKSATTSVSLAKTNNEGLMLIKQYNVITNTLTENSSVLSDDVEKYDKNQSHGAEKKKKPQSNTKVITHTKKVENNSFKSKGKHNAKVDIKLEDDDDDDLFSSDTDTEITANSTKNNYMENDDNFNDYDNYQDIDNIDNTDNSNMLDDNNDGFTTPPKVSRSISHSQSNDNDVNHGEDDSFETIFGDTTLDSIQDWMKKGHSWPHSFNTTNSVYSNGEDTQFDISQSNQENETNWADKYANAHSSQDKNFNNDNSLNISEISPIQPNQNLFNNTFQSDPMVRDYNVGFDEYNNNNSNTFQHIPGLENFPPLKNTTYSSDTTITATRPIPGRENLTDPSIYNDDADESKRDVKLKSILKNVNNTTTSATKPLDHDITSFNPYDGDGGDNISNTTTVDRNSSQSTQHSLSSRTSDPHSNSFSLSITSSKDSIRPTGPTKRKRVSYTDGFQYSPSSSDTPTTPTTDSTRTYNYDDSMRYGGKGVIYDYDDSDMMSIAEKRQRLRQFGSFEQFEQELGQKKDIMTFNEFNDAFDKTAQYKPFVWKEDEYDDIISGPTGKKKTTPYPQLPQTDDEFADVTIHNTDINRGTLHRGQIGRIKNNQNLAYTSRMTPQSHLGIDDSSQSISRYRNDLQNQRGRTHASSLNRTPTGQDSFSSKSTSTPPRTPDQTQKSNTDLTKIHHTARFFCSCCSKPYYSSPPAQETFMLCKRCSATNIDPNISGTSLNSSGSISLDASRSMLNASRSGILAPQQPVTIGPLIHQYLGSPPTTPAPPQQQPQPQIPQTPQTQVPLQQSFIDLNQTHQHQHQQSDYFPPRTIQQAATVTNDPRYSRNTTGISEATLSNNSMNTSSHTLPQNITQNLNLSGISDDYITTLANEYQIWLQQRQQHQNRDQQQQQQKQQHHQQVSFQTASTQTSYHDQVSNQQTNNTNPSSNVQNLDNIVPSANPSIKLKPRVNVDTHLNTDNNSNAYNPHQTQADQTRGQSRALFPNQQPTQALDSSMFVPRKR